MRYINNYNKYLKEGIGNEKLNYYAKLFFGGLFSPITVPVWINMSSESKIELLIEITIENYLDERAEYEILDELKYDIEKPSELNKVRRRLKWLNSRFKKWPIILLGRLKRTSLQSLNLSG